MEGCCRHRCHLKTQKHRFTNTGSKLQVGTAAQKMPETYGEELNCLLSGHRLEEQISPRLKCQQVPLFLCWALPHKAWGPSGHQIWVSINLANRAFSPPWWFWDPMKPIQFTHPAWTFEKLIHTSNQPGPALHTRICPMSTNCRQAAVGLCVPCVSWSSSPKPSTSGSHPQFKA